MPDPDSQTEGPMFGFGLVLTATASATHPEGAIVPATADLPPQE